MLPVPKKNNAACLASMTCDCHVEGLGTEEAADQIVMMGMRMKSGVEMAPTI